ncbi:MAG: hypothetical protein WCG26_09705 [Chloroflexales bacterium]
MLIDLSYVIHLDLDEFLAALTGDVFCDDGYIQILCIPERSAGIHVANTLRAMITVPVGTLVPAPESPLGMIHALRLTLEVVPLGGISDADQQALDAAVSKRASTINDFLRAELIDRGVMPRTGIMLVSGLREDLAAYDGSQRRWRIVQTERGNPLSRRLEWL